MLLKEKFPDMESHYSSLNDVPFSEKKYSSIEKLFWKCDHGHPIYKSALEYQRYPSCMSCVHINEKGLEYQESLAYCYPSIAVMLSPKNSRSADSIRPDSQLLAHWLDTEERITVFDRVRDEISQGKVTKNHIPRKRAIKCKSDPHSVDGSVSRQAQLLSTIIDKLPECLDDIAGITVGSNKVLQWKCDVGHIFTSTVRNTIKRKRKCTVCSGMELQVGVNDIATLYPQLSRSIVSPDPMTITASYSGEVHYQCSQCTHEWYAPLPYKRLKHQEDCAQCPSCSGNVVTQGVNDLASILPYISQAWSRENQHQPHEVRYGSEKTVLLDCSQCGKIISAQPYVLTSGHRERKNFLCGQCSRSHGEQEIAEFAASIVGKDNVLTNIRDVIPPKELDIYIPGKNIAIEFNGVYWHSESQGRDKWYHYDKWRACADQGIQLITIWEDEWLDNREIVQKMLTHKLGAAQEKLYARSTTVKTVDTKTARRFCDEHHIQGFAPGSIYFGLYHKNSLVALSIWKKENATLYLSRYCTDVAVVGGMGKLLKAGQQYAKAHGCNQIVTFSDHCVSNGGLYTTLGFILDKELPPDYHYVVGDNRVHKFNYRVQRFDKDSGLLFAPGLSESKLAKLNGLSRIWDCGKTRWLINVQR